MNLKKEGKCSEEQYYKALEYATLKHEGQFRIGGKPYITHPIGVAEIVRKKGYDRVYQITALFHDLLEDTDATEEEILKYGNEQVLEAVQLLTKPKNYVMKEYVEGVRSNDIAFVVKAADRLHNLLSAVETNENFKRKYILETIEWYFDFDPEIVEATKHLAETMDHPVDEQVYKL